MSNHDFDFKRVTLVVEYLPGYKLHVPVSVEFADENLANLSLKYVQQTYPHARLATYVDAFDEAKESADPQYAYLVKQTRKRDEFYRKQFLINH